MSIFHDVFEHALCNGADKIDSSIRGTGKWDSQAEVAGSSGTRESVYSSPRVSSAACNATCARYA